MLFAIGMGTEVGRLHTAAIMLILTFKCLFNFAEGWIGALSTPFVLLIQKLFSVFRWTNTCFFFE